MSSPPLRWHLKPFPRLPPELTHHVVLLGGDTVGLSPAAQPGDEHAASTDGARWWAVCCLVSKEWLSIAQPLLFAHPSLASIPSTNRLLSSLLLRSPLLGRPLASYVKTFTYATWSPPDEDGSPAQVDYTRVVGLRKRLVDVLLKHDGVVEVVFPTIVWPLLADVAEPAPSSSAAAVDDADASASSTTSLVRAPTNDAVNGGGPAGRARGLRKLGTVLAVENRRLSAVFASPSFSSLEDLSIWYGDPATGPLALPRTLKTLHVRCDHFSQGNNLDFPPASSASTAEADGPFLPSLLTLRFEFTTRHYPEASPWGPTPTLLANVGPTVERLGMAADRGTDPAEAVVDPRVWTLCPKLEVLELANHRFGPVGDGAAVEGEAEGDPATAAAASAPVVGHKRLREIHYRLDPSQPFALAPPSAPSASSTAADDGVPPAAPLPAVADVLALSELSTLLLSPSLPSRFPALARLSLSNLPSPSYLLANPHAATHLAALCALPARARELGRGVEVTDIWGRPVEDVLRAQANPFVGRSLERLPHPTSPTSSLPMTTLAPAADNDADGDGKPYGWAFARRLAAGGRDASVSPAASSSSSGASTAGVRTPADGVGVGSGGGGRGGYFAFGAGSSGTAGKAVDDTAEDDDVRMASDESDAD